MLNKSFRCQTDLTLEACKARLQAEFPKRFLSNIRLLSLVDSRDSASFTVGWTGSDQGSFPMRLDATLTQKSDHVQVMGHARPTLLGLILALYFPAISLILVFVFLPIVWLSAFFLLVFCLTALVAYKTYQARKWLIDKVCNVLDR